MNEQERKNIHVLVRDLQKRFDNSVDDTIACRMLEYFEMDSENYYENSMDIRIVLATGKIEEYLSDKKFTKETAKEKIKRLLLK